MLKFPKIYNLRNMMRHQRPTGVVSFTGTVKLHGTNAGIRVDPDGTVTAQSRNRVLSIQDDNAGFAAWLHGHADEYRELARWCYGTRNAVTFFGEWIGPGIQKGVAVCSAPDREFVGFAIALEHPDGVVWRAWYGEGTAAVLSTHEVDFGDADSIDAFEQRAQAAADEVGRVCPHANRQHGILGPGEGVVWCNYDTGLLFKTKARGFEESTRLPRIREDRGDVDHAAATRFVSDTVTAHRLHQGLEHLRDQGLAPVPENTRQFIRWVSDDIGGEHVEELLHAGLVWRDVSKLISREAARWYLNRVGVARAVDNTETGC